MSEVKPHQRSRFLGLAIKELEADGYFVGLGLTTSKKEDGPIRVDTWTLRWWKSGTKWRVRRSVYANAAATPAFNQLGMQARSWLQASRSGNLPKEQFAEPDL